MSELSVLLTPNVLTAIAYIVGALLIGVLVIAGIVYLAKYLGWLI